MTVLYYEREKGERRPKGNLLHFFLIYSTTFGTLALIPAQTASASTAANTLQYVGASCSKSRKLTTANPRTHAARQQHDVAGTRARDVRPLPRHSPPSS